MCLKIRCVLRKTTVGIDLGTLLRGTTQREIEMFAHYDGTLEDSMCVKHFSSHACVMIAVSEVVFRFADVFPFFSVTVLCFGGSIG